MIVKIVGVKSHPIQRAGATERYRERDIIGYTEITFQETIVIIIGSEESFITDSVVSCTSNVPHRVKKGSRVFKMGSKGLGEAYSCEYHFRRLQTIDQLIAGVDSNKYYIEGTICDLFNPSSVIHTFNKR